MPTPPLMNERPGTAARWCLLRRLAVVAWVTSIALLALIWLEDRAKVIHPAVVPFVILLALTILAGVVGVLAGLWRFIRGPRRLAAAGWMIVALLPTIAWATLLSWGLNRLDQRNLESNFLLRLTARFGGSLMEAEARFTYPHRMESDRVVMFYGDGVIDPAADLARMDRHVARMEQLTGLPLREKIYWVRGPLIRVVEGFSVFGLAIARRNASIEYIDFHEAAHALMHQRGDVLDMPPTLILEGWAQCQSDTRRSMARIALNERAQIAAWRKLPEAQWPAAVSGEHYPAGHLQLVRAAGADGVVPSWLRELTSPAWYHRPDGPIYHVGGAFVDYLLRRYGAGKFVQLYYRVKPGTFAADCREVLGVDLRTLEQAFWKDVEEQALAPAKAGFME